MRRILITGGRVIDPGQNLDRVTNVLVEGNRIAAFDVTPGETDRIIDATGKIVCPGLVDMHAELREPGCEEDETIETGAAAALAGGFTSIACIPNTEPPLDSQASVEFVRHTAERARRCHVFPVACVSKNREGKELAEIGSLVEAGAVAFSDAARPITNSDLLRRALQYCLMFDKPILDHPEALELTQGGIMHEGQVSLVLGLLGMPAEAEDIMTGRNIRLAESTGGRLHLMNVSTAGSVELIRRAKGRGVRVTAEVCPPHFALTDQKLRGFESNYKLNPPLRSADHVAAVIAGLVDGTIDVIASGHTPRASEKKMQELDRAPFGMVSLETTLAMVITFLVETGKLSWPQALAKLTLNPARALGIPKGGLAVGCEADITIIDPQSKWTVQTEMFHSKSGNTPLAGMQLTGRASHVLVSGEPRFEHGKLLA